MLDKIGIIGKIQGVSAKNNPKPKNVIKTNCPSKKIKFSNKKGVNYPYKNIKTCIL